MQEVITIYEKFLSVGLTPSRAWRSAHIWGKIAWNCSIGKAMPSRC